MFAVGESLLVVAREHALRFAIQRFFEARGVSVHLSTADDAVVERAYDAVLVDHIADEEVALRSIVARCRATKPDTAVVLLADRGTEFPADVVCQKPLPLDELARHLGVGVRERT